MNQKPLKFKLSNQENKLDNILKNFKLVFIKQKRFVKPKEIFEKKQKQRRILNKKYSKLTITKYLKPTPCI